MYEFAGRPLAAARSGLPHRTGGSSAGPWKAPPRPAARSGGSPFRPPAACRAHKWPTASIEIDGHDGPAAEIDQNAGNLIAVDQRLTGLRLAAHARRLKR